MISSDISSILQWIAKRLFVAAMIVPLLGYAADNAESSPRFDIHVNPALARYLDLLEYPPYLELALENNGVEITAAGKLLILNEHAAQIKNVTLGDVNIEPTLVFSHREGAVFFYKASMMDVSVPVNIDASSLGNGTISIIFPKSSNNIVLSRFSKAIGEKIQMLANDSLQQRMLKYFDEIALKKPESRNEKEWIVSQIMLEGYNKRAFGETNFSSIETQSDWWLLLLGSIVAVLIYLNRGWFSKGKQSS